MQRERVSQLSILGHRVKHPPGLENGRIVLALSKHWCLAQVRRASSIAECVRNSFYGTEQDFSPAENSALQTQHIMQTANTVRGVTRPTDELWDFLLGVTVY